VKGEREEGGGEDSRAHVEYRKPSSPIADLRAFLFVLPIADDEGGSLCRLLIEKDILSHRKKSN